jgi:hypothetical protein
MAACSGGRNSQAEKKADTERKPLATLGAAGSACAPRGYTFTSALSSLTMLDKNDFASPNSISVFSR